MGLFSKKKKEESGENLSHKLPSLPALPGHSEFPEIPQNNQTPGDLLNLKNEDDEIHQLPSFPTNSIGEKFSQDTIKTAVGEEEFNNFDYENDENMPKMIPEKVNEPMLKSMPHLEDEEIEKINKNEAEKIEIEKKLNAEYKTINKNEPVFIRIDKFEESLHVFKIAKKKISEIEDLLKETKEIKQKEEKELMEWENKILKLKDQIEKVNEDIFSKIE